MDQGDLDRVFGLCRGGQANRKAQACGFHKFAKGFHSWLLPEFHIIFNTAASKAGLGAIR